jgi:hypothetical protein
MGIIGAGEVVMGKTGIGVPDLILMGKGAIVGIQ